MTDKEQDTPEPKLMSEPERRQLALDIMDGKIFGTWNVRKTDGPETIGMIFMPLVLGAKLPKGVAHIYEYLSEAGPRSINGYPCFMSLRMLMKEDATAIFPMMDELKKQRDAFMKGEDNATDSPKEDDGRSAEHRATRPEGGARQST